MRNQRGGSSATIVVSADHHLGQTAPNLSAAQRDIRAGYLRDEFSAVIAYCLEKSADALLLAGDVFDTPAPSPDDISWMIRQLQPLNDADTVVAAVSGDSDAGPVNGVSAVGLLGQMGVLRSLDDADQSSPAVVKIAGKDTVIGGLPVDPSLREPSDPLSRFTSPGGQPPQILITHYSIEGVGEERLTGPVIRRESILQLSELQLLVSGHNHTPAQEAMGQAAIVMPGSPLGKGGFMSIELTPEGVQNVEIIDGRGAPKVVIHARGSDLETDDPLSLLKLMVESRISPESETVLQVHGETDRASLHRAGLAKLARWAAGRCASFEVDLTDLKIQSDSPISLSESASTAEEIRRIATQTAGHDEAMEAGPDEAAELVLSALGSGQRRGR